MNMGKQGSDVTSSGASTVFVSYSRDDQKRALPIIQILEQAGFTVWWDGLLEGGERFANTTEDALERAKAIVVLWSATSCRSHWVHDEATRGRDRKCLVPLSIDGVEPPLGFRQFQVIDATAAKVKAGSAEMQKLVRAVAALHDRPEDFVLSAASGRAAPDRRAILVGSGVLALGGLGAAAWWSGLVGADSAIAASVAVMPFDNLSGDPSQSYFSDGLAAEVRSELSRNELLQVAASTSSNVFRERGDDVKEIARKLGVAFLLEGSVRRAGNTVKIGAQLIDGRTGFEKWTKTFDRSMTDIFAVQTEIATAIATQLSAQIETGNSTKTRDIRASGGTKSVAAFDAYLRGKDLYDAGIDENSDRQALSKFEEALAEDSQYAAAHAGRSRSLAVIANLYAKGAERASLFAAAVKSAHKAVALAPEYPEAFSALGFAIAFGQLNVKDARAPYEKSYALGKGDADVISRYAVFLSRLGDYARANQAILQSSALDPLNARTFRSTGDINYGAGRYDAAVAAYEKALSLNPKLSGANASIGFARFIQGDLAGARKAFAAESNKERKLTGAALIEYRQGNKVAAQEALAAMRDEFGEKSHYQYAQIYAQWGDSDKAILELQNARAKDDSGLIMMYNDPLLAPLRKRPEFSDLLKSIGFV